MDTHHANGQSQSPSDVPSLPEREAQPAISAWRRYVHLYAPMIASIFALSLSPAIHQALGLPTGTNILPITASFAIPTYLAASLFYPINQPEPTPEQSIRFTRKNDFYRAGVIATYGRLFDAPYNVTRFLMDVLLSYGADQVIGERAVGTKQRRSNFLVALTWIVGSRMVALCLAFDTPVLQRLVVMVDRTLFRTAYVALVDDVVGVLTQPNIRTFKGKITLIATQAFVICAIGLVFVAWAMSHSGEIESALAEMNAELGDVSSKTP